MRHRPITSSFRWRHRWYAVRVKTGFEGWRVRSWQHAFHSVLRRRFARSDTPGSGGLDCSRLARSVGRCRVGLPDPGKVTSGDRKRGWCADVVGRGTRHLWGRRAPDPSATSVLATAGCRYSRATPVTTRPGRRTDPTQPARIIDRLTRRWGRRRLVGIADREDDGTLRRSWTE